jgi:hypothetical protein
MQTKIQVHDPTSVSEKSLQWLVVLLLAIGLVLNALSARNLSLTADESDHFLYGIHVLGLNSDRFDDSKMPFTALNAIPYASVPIVKNALGEGSRLVTIFRDIRTGRYVTILFWTLLGFYVFKWSSEMYGTSAGLFSLVLFIFSPNILAHSQLVTTDLYATCTITIALYYFWKFLNSGGWVWGGVSALTFGIAQLAKYTSAYLCLIFPMIVLIHFSPWLWSVIEAKNISVFLKGVYAFSKYLTLFIAVSILVINLGFLFNKTFVPLREYEFKSRVFKGLTSKIWGLKWVPAPLAYPYLQGLDWVKYNEESGKSYGHIYLLGKSQKAPFKGYYFFAYIFKEPIPLQIFLLCSLTAYWMHRFEFAPLNNELFLLLPVVFFAVYFNFFFKAQIGIRYFIVVFPLLYIFCGLILKVCHPLSLGQKYGIGVLITYLIISVISFYPHYISYFNEFLRDRKKAYTILADSNLDWDQNDYYLKDFLARNHGAKLNPESPMAGQIVVSANKLVGIENSPSQYRWLRENFEPVTHIAYSFLVFDVKPEKLCQVLHCKEFSPEHQ